MALLDPDGAIIAVNKAWRDFSEKNGGRCDYVGWNYLDVCRRSAACGSKHAARTCAGLTNVLDGSRRDFGQAYECQGDYYRLRALSVASDDGKQVLVSHENITDLVRARARSARRRWPRGGLSRN